MNHSEKFNFDEALKALQSGQTNTGKDGVLAPLIKQLTKAALEGEVESHITDDVIPNDSGRYRKSFQVPPESLFITLRNMHPDRQLAGITLKSPPQGAEIRKSHK